VDDVGGTAAAVRYLLQPACKGRPEGGWLAFTATHNLTMEQRRPRRHTSGELKDMRERSEWEPVKKGQIRTREVRERSFNNSVNGTVISVPI
jgi:hypothetical protein